MIVTRYHRIFYKLFWNLYKLLTGIQPGVYIQDVDHIHIGNLTSPFDLFHTNKTAMA